LALLNSFGEFQVNDSFDGMDWTVFLLAIFIIALVMMNLIIGIIHEKLSDLLDLKVQNNYKNLLDIIIDLEAFMVWNRIWTRTDKMHHLVFCEEKKIEESSRIKQV
jgi:hypothetical protein